MAAEVWPGARKQWADIVVWFMAVLISKYSTANNEMYVLFHTEPGKSTLKKESGGILDGL